MQHGTDIQLPTDKILARKADGIGWLDLQPAGATQRDLARDVGRGDGRGRGLRRRPLGARRGDERCRRQGVRIRRRHQRVREGARRCRCRGRVCPPLGTREGSARRPGSAPDRDDPGLLHRRRSGDGAAGGSAHRLFGQPLRHPGRPARGLLRLRFARAADRAGRSGARQGDHVPGPPLHGRPGAGDAPRQPGGGAGASARARSRKSPPRSCATRRSRSGLPRSRSTRSPVARSGRIAPGSRPPIATASTAPTTRKAGARSWRSGRRSSRDADGGAGRPRGSGPAPGTQGGVRQIRNGAIAPGVPCPAAASRSPAGPTGGGQGRPETTSSMCGRTRWNGRIFAAF